MPWSYDKEFRVRAGELLAKGMSISAVGRLLGVDRQTIGRWSRNDPILRQTILEGRLKASQEVLDHADDLRRMAFNKEETGGVRLRAHLEVLKSLDPVSWDTTFRRRVAEAEQPDLFNQRIQFQEYLDKRDEKIQAENAAKALDAKAEDDEDPKGQLSLQLFIEDLRKVQKEAGDEVAKQADNYEEPKPNGKGNGHG